MNWSKNKKRSLVLRLAGANLLLLMIASILSSFLTAHFKKKAYLEAEESRMRGLAISTVASLKNIVAVQNYNALAAPIAKILRNNLDIASIVVEDEKGKIVYDSDKAFYGRLKLVEKGQAKLKYYDPIAEKALVAIKLPFQEGKLTFGHLKLFYYPLSVLERERQNNLLSVGGSILSTVSELLANFQYFEIAELSKNIIKEHKDIEYFIIQDRENLSLFHSDEAKARKVLKDRLSQEAQRKVTPSSPILIQRVKVKGEDLVDIALLLENGGEKIGLLRLGYSLRTLRLQEAKDRAKMVAIIFFSHFLASHL